MLQTFYIPDYISGGDVQTTLARRVAVCSFFKKSKLSLQQWVVIIHCWVREYPVTRAAEEAKVTEMTAMPVNVCSWRLTSVDSPLLLVVVLISISS